MKTWETLADRSNGLYTQDDFRNAAYQLVAQQVLYYRNPHQRTAYHLITEHRAAFKEVLDLLGIDVEVNDAFKFCAAIPRYARSVALPLMDTLLMLVLRKVYHEHVQRGEMDEGVIHVSIEELKGAFQSATARTLPERPADLSALLLSAQRAGIARMNRLDGDDIQPYDIAILPGIAAVLNASTLHRLAAFRDAPKPAEEPAEDGDEAT
ncbi:MAG TPA: DUF4194 domain-containing protein [Rudaea sp.]|jgi:hypothetical protein